MQTRSLLITALLLPLACDEADDFEQRDNAWPQAESAAVESSDALEAEAHRLPVDDDDLSCDADFTLVDPGEENAFFRVVSPHEVDLDPDLDFTIDPDGSTLHADNGNGGIQLFCRCGDSCLGGSGGCIIGWEGETASCYGDCSSNGESCGSCGWHHSDTPPPPPPPSRGPRAAKPALPGGGANALP